MKNGSDHYKVLQTIAAKPYFKKIAYVIAALIILFAILAVAIRLLTPILDKNRLDVEKWASELLKAPVKVKHVEVAWYRYQPVITLNEVTVFNHKTHEPIIQIEKLQLFFSIPKSLWYRRIIPAGVLLDGADLTIYRSKNGEITVQGFPVLKGLNKNAGPFKSETKFIDLMGWVSAQPQILLQNINIVYTDFNAQKRAITLKNFNLKNDSFTHHISGDVVLVQHLSTAVKFILNWEGEIEQIEKIKADAYLQVSALSLNQWLKNTIWKGWEVQNGVGSLKMWLFWRDNHLHKVQSTFRFFDLILFSNTNKTTHRLNRFSGNLGWQHDGDNQILAGDDLIIDLAQHLWPVTNFYFSAEQKQNKEWEPNLIVLSYLDLQDVLTFLFSSPPILSSSIESKLKTLKPRGNLQGINLKIKSPVFNAQNISLMVGFNQLSLNALETYPAVNNISGQINWDGKNGELTLNSKNISFDNKKYFANSIHLAELNTEIKWNRVDKTWVIHIPNLELGNEDISAMVSGNVTISPAGLPYTDLTAKFSLFNLQKLNAYLPVKIMDPQLAAWLKGAFSSGQLQTTEAILQGPLDHFPFRDKTGKFLISADVEDVSLHFADNWPSLQKVNGKLAFINEKLLINIVNADLVGITLKNLQAEVPDLLNQQSLQLDIKMDPIQTDFAHAFKVVRQSPLDATLGKLATNLFIEGPLNINLALMIPLKKIDEVKVNGELSFEGAKLQVIPIKLNIDQVRGMVHFTDKSTIANNIQGRFLNNPLQVNIKTLGVEKKLQHIRADFSTQVPITELGLQFQLPILEILKGSFALNGEIDIQPNQPLEITMTSNLSGTTISLPPPYGKDGKEEKKIKVQVKMEDKKPPLIKVNYANTDLQVEPSQQKIKIDINSDDIEGQLTYLPHPNHLSKLEAHFRYLRLHSLDNKTSNFSALNVKSLPVISFQIDKLHYNHFNIGSVNVATSRKENGLDFQFIRITSPLVLIRAQGEWIQKNNQNHTQLQGVISSPKVSEFLNSIGVDVHNFIATKGVVKFDLNWANAPYAVTPADLNGDMNIDIGKGRIVDVGDSASAKMGLGRMLSLFSLQTIPRRLTFDFSDVFQKGYSFDYFKGDYTFENGVAETNNSRIDGPVARIDIDGSIGFKNKDFDLTLTIIPYATSNLPLAATLLNPYVGVAAWAVNKMIGSPLSKLTAYTYQVTGPWDDPDWKSVSVKKENVKKESHPV